MIKELPSIPDGWAYFTLSELTESDKNSIKRGPFGSSIKKEHFVLSGYKVYEQKNAIYDDFSLGNYYISEDKFQELIGFSVKPGDFIISCSGTIGKIAIIPEGAQLGVINQALLKIALNQETIDKNYFLRLFRSDFFQTIILGNVQGSAMMNISSVKELKKSYIPLPPLNEQRRIVSTIEQLTDRSHKARTALEDVPKLIAQFRQSVLAAAFRGDLTADWREKNPDIESASELLERIRVERKKCWEESLIAKGKNPQKSKYKEAEEITNQIRYELPETWSWMTLGDVAWSVKDGPHYSPQYSETGIPFITGGNVRAEGIDFENVKYISPELHKELSQRCLPEYGDVLYTKGGTTGIARVNTYENEFNVWVHVAVLKCVSSIERFYLQHALNSPWCYQQSQLFTHGTGNQDLGLTRMINILVPLAPKPEQIEIVRRVEIYMKAINTLCQEFDGYTEQLDLLDRSILAKAFRGELVPQDPNDEPATVLLERIRSERAQTSTPKERGKTTRKNISKQLSINLE